MYLYQIIMKDSERQEGSTSLCFMLCSFLGFCRNECLGSLMVSLSRHLMDVVHSSAASELTWPGYFFSGAISTGQTEFFHSLLIFVEVDDKLCFSSDRQQKGSAL